VPRLLRAGVVPIERLREVIALAVADAADENASGADTPASGRDTRPPLADTPASGAEAAEGEAMPTAEGKASSG
jgi:hypothetical protein